MPSNGYQTMRAASVQTSGVTLAPRPAIAAGNRVSPTTMIRPVIPLAVLVFVSISCTVPGQSIRLLKETYGAAESVPTDFTQVGNSVFFVTEPYATNFNLHRSDIGGSGSLTMHYWRFTKPTDLVGAGGMLLFTINGSLWSSDGTDKGTAKMPGAPTNSTGLTAFGSRALFAASDTNAGVELWVSAGTAATTSRVKDIVTGIGSSRPSQITVAGSVAFLTADNGKAGDELWRTDGTAAGTVMVKDIRPGPSSSGIRYMVAGSGGVWFFANSGVGDALWRSDGTAKGTVRVVTASANATLTPLGTGAVALQPRNNRTELWFTDGSATGTRLLKIVSATTSAIPAIRPVVAPGSLVYFTTMSTSGNAVLWRTDGSTRGTVQLTNAASELPRDARLAVLGTAVHFPAGVGSRKGVELWSSRGAPANTIELKNIHATGSSAPRGLTTIGNLVWMQAHDGVVGRDPWVTDGTHAGTTLSCRPNWSTSYLHHYFEAYGRAAFVYIHRGNTVLWQSDGTKTGTTPIILPRRGGGIDHYRVLSGAGKVFLSLDPGGRIATDLWTTDFTQAGTRSFHTRCPNANDMVDLGDTAVFEAGSGLWGGTQVLWKTDGTVKGTVALGTSRLAFSQSLFQWTTPYQEAPSQFARFGQEVYFAVQSGYPRTGRLWRTDGTVKGTSLIAATKSLEMLAPPIRFRNKIVFATKKSTLCFTDGTTGGTAQIPTAYTPQTPFYQPLIANSRGVFALFDTMWFSDGTTKGTIKLAPKPVFGGASVFRDRLYFVAATKAHGRELWVSDGTTVGTYMLKDIAKGPANSLPTHFTPTGSRFMYFFAQVKPPVSWAYELWRTDGTAKGTTRVPGQPGWTGGYYTGLSHIGGRLFTAFVHPRLGFQPFVIDIDANNKPHGVGCAAPRIPPVLRATDPVLGGTTTWSVRDGRARQPGAFLFGLAPSLPSGEIRVPGCTVLVDVRAPFAVVPYTTNAAGSASLTVPVPRNPILVGARTMLQAAIGGSALRPLGMDLTNGVGLTPGN
jgi:ELWxxDGT repeat protein